MFKILILKKYIYNIKIKVEEKSKYQNENIKSKYFHESIRNEKSNKE